MSNWLMSEVGDDIHITPIDDLKEHEFSVGCPCEPEVEKAEVGCMIIHESYDLREVIEKAYSILYG